jgi:hypothetical protein
VNKILSYVGIGIGIVIAIALVCIAIALLATQAEPPAGSQVLIEAKCDNAVALEHPNTGVGVTVIPDTPNPVEYHRVYDIINTDGTLSDKIVSCHATWGGKEWSVSIE